MTAALAAGRDLPILPRERSQLFGEILPKSRGFGRNAALFGFGLAAAVVVVFAFGAPARALPASEAPVYAIDNYPFQKAPALLRWRSVLRRAAHLAERADPDDCKDGKPRLSCAAKEAQLLEEKLETKSPAEQVAAVYAYFNAIKYKEHGPQCGIDCWKSRLQFLAQREGDCGDHALAEYFTLKRLGFEERDLQLIVAQLPGFEDSFKGGHVVLRVRAEGEYYILDNRRTDLTDLSGLRHYKVLAGLNADSVQIYNLVTPAPPPGFVAEATQVASLITSPGTAPEASPTEETGPAPAEASEPPAQPILVAAAAAAPKPEAAVAKGDEDAVCLQTANLADWNPFLPCTPAKAFKMVVKAKTIIGAEPPKPAELQPPKPVEVAEALKAPEPKASERKSAAPKAPEAKVAAKPAVVAPAPKPESVADAEDKDESGVCVQGARLADWNPDLPCTEDGSASSLRIEFTE
jgi:predicted transglutaminase-like cysteine proteinase